MREERGNGAEPPGAAVGGPRAGRREPVGADVPGPEGVASPLTAGYQAMAADTAREAEAMDWCHALAGDLAADPHSGTVGGGPSSPPSLRRRPCAPPSRHS